MTFEEYWSIVAEKTGKTVTKEQLKYYCEIAYGQGQASIINDNERPQGEWIMEENNKDYPEGRATCSHCGYKMDVKRWEWLPAVRWYLKPNYCPECGAKMKGEGEC